MTKIVKKKQILKQKKLPIMKTKKFLFLAAIALVFSFSCRKAEKNVVTDFAPVHRWDTHAQATWDTLRTIPDGEKVRFITKNIPNLIPKIIEEVKYASKQKIEVTKLVFAFGSGKAKGVMDGSGIRHDGIYENELIAKLWTNPVTELGDPIIVFVRCLNGMISIEGHHEISGIINCRFEIQPGQGLAHHLPQLEAWANVAGNFQIPIRDKNGKVVSQEKYLSYLGRYESVLFPGDIIDMCQGKVFNKAGQEVQFDRRLAETNNANAKAKKNGKKRK